MGVIAVQLSTTGLIPNTTGLGNALSQQLPVPIFIETSDALATVLVTGYLNKSRNDFQFPYNNQQMALVYTTDAGTVWLSVIVSGANYSLQGTTNVSTVYEASVGSAAAPSFTFVGRTDVGLYSAAAHELDVAISGAKVAAFTATGLAVTGLISATTSITAGTSLTATAGAVTSGSAAGGFAGSLILFSNTAANGSLRMLTVGNAGNFAAIISDVSTLGQASTYTLPDPGNAAARFLVGATATPFVSGNFPKASGTGGLMVDSGIAVTALQLSANIKAAQVASLGGGGAGPLTVTAAGATTSSIINVSILASSNTVSVSKVVPGTGNFALTLSGDPGATLTIQYSMFIAAQ